VEHFSSFLNVACVLVQLTIGVAMKGKRWEKEGKRKEKEKHKNCVLTRIRTLVYT